MKRRSFRHVALAVVQMSFASSLLSANAAAAASLAPPSSVVAHGLSPWSMFMNADWVVKIVIIGLALASIATWTVLVRKVSELARGVTAHRAALARIDDVSTLDKAVAITGDDAEIATALLASAKLELRQSADVIDDVDGLKERVVSRLDRIEAAAVRRMQHGTSILATIGATAPFVGLFGTVWGIMNSFIGIAETQTTNLAVVAPGIAEALLATAVGLIAAIPAVVIYNHFARQIAGYKALIGDISAAVLRLVSRDASQGLRSVHNLHEGK